MANRLVGAIERANASAARLTAARLQKLHKDLKTPWKDLVEYQNLQSRAFALGQLSLSEAQMLYRIYGGEAPSPEKWDDLSIGEKIVGTKAAGELLEKIHGLRNPAGKASVVACPICRTAVSVSPRETRSEALREHIRQARHNPMKALNPKQALYRSFHGSDPQRTRRVKVPVPTGHLIAIGRATRIEYEPYGASKYNKTRFYHDFGDLGGSKIKARPILATDEKGESLFIIPQHSRYPRFSERGILG